MKRITIAALVVCLITGCYRPTPEPTDEQKSSKIISSTSVNFDHDSKTLLVKEINKNGYTIKRYGIKLEELPRDEK